LAAQALYGLPTSTPLSGGQTFGFNCNVAGASEMFFDFTKNTTPVITVWDMGANNTLDLSGFSASATVNLNPGTFSSCDEMTNNIAIAYNTSIDTLVCGSGNDVVTCNSQADTIYTGAGNDTVTGGAGSDTFYAGSGNDTLDGGAAFNKVVFSGNRSAYTITHNGNGSTTVSGPGSTDTLTHIQKLVFSDQTVMIGSPPTSDFNGNGTSDILWQITNGQAAIWFLNGTTLLAGSGALSPNPGTSWKAVGSGDFDADGEADILWQNTSGQASIWLMNGRTILSGSGNAGTNPGTSWKVKGAEDFNGDGNADILWQNTNGQAAVWLMSGTTILSGGNIGSNPGTSWSVVAGTGG
jgi:hypothetical protein